MNNSTKLPDYNYGIDDISDAEIYFNAVFLSIVMIITIVGNSLALHAFFISPQLKQITYYFIASLCISDLMVALFSISLWVVDLLNKWGPDGLPEAFKVLYQCVDIFGGTWSIMSLAVISVERYICIKHSLHYSYIMTLKRVYTLFAFLLVYCSIVTLLNQRYIDENGTGHVVKQFAIVFMAYVLPVIIKVFTYSQIYIEAKKQSKQISELRKYTLTLGGNSPDNDSITKSTDSLSASMKRSFRKELSDESDSPRLERACTLKTVSSSESKQPLMVGLAHSNIFLKFLCFHNYRVQKTSSTYCLHYAREKSDSNGTVRITNTNENRDIGLTADTPNHMICNRLAENEFGNDASCENDETQTRKRPKLTYTKSLDVSPMEELRRHRLAVRTFSTDDAKCMRKNLNPISAMEEYDSKHTSSEGSGTPIRNRLRTLTKWSPASSPLIVRKFNKKSSEHKRNEQKIRRFKKELRAAKVVALIMGTFLVCWTPFSILMLLFAIRLDSVIVMRYIMLAKLFHYMNSAINPILYVVLNKVYRTAVVKVIKKFTLFSDRW